MKYYNTHIKDVLGNNYLGIKIDSGTVDPFLYKLSEILSPDKYELYTANAQRRDRGKFHITVISVPEYNKLVSKMGIDKFVNSLDMVLKYEIDDLKMMGIGMAQKGENTAYFVVCKSEKLDSIRSRYGLEEKDFHITLGFNPKDVFGVRKNVLIKEDDKFIKLLSQEYYKKRNFEFIKNIENFKLDKDAEIIPVSIEDNGIKVICGDYYLDVYFPDDLNKFWIMAKYPVLDSKKHFSKMSRTEIEKILTP
jgi:hypothetical protein